MRDLDGRVAIVTGGGSGIGAECAAAMASAGAQVVVADINGDAAGSVVQAIDSRAASGRAIACQVDVRVEAEVEGMIDAAISQFGRLDILHNNAAYNSRAAAAGGYASGNVTEISLEEWETSLAITLGGTMLGCKHAIPPMIDGGGGAIINTASTIAFAADTKAPAYTAAKAGVVALTRHVATAFGASGIRCNSIAPGPIETPGLERAYDDGGRQRIARHIASGRLGQASEVASAVVFLASDDASFVNGQVLVIDGGSLIHQPWAVMHPDP